MRCSKIDAQNNPAVLNNAAGEGQQGTDGADIWFCQSRHHFLQPIIGPGFNVIVQQAEHVTFDGRGRAIVEPCKVKWPFDMLTPPRDNISRYSRVSGSALSLSTIRIGATARHSRPDAVDAGPRAQAGFGSER